MASPLSSSPFQYQPIGQGEEEDVGRHPPGPTSPTGSDLGGGKLFRNSFDIEFGRNNNSSESALLGGWKRRTYWIVFISTLSALILRFFLSSPLSSPAELPREGGSLQGAGSFDSRGRYRLTDYDEGNPVSNFLPGLGGLWGTPLWCFYVNRGQAITSFGIQNKDSAIMKFYTAEKAYQNTPFVGFRTFMKVTRLGKPVQTYEPFSSMVDKARGDLQKKPSRDMYIGMNELEIEESDFSMNLRSNVLYFTVPDEDFPALARQITITNLDNYTGVTLEVLDGIAKLIPAGLTNGALDNMGRTMEAWMNVYNVGDHGNIVGGIKQPFYHISQGTADTAQVQQIKDGNFALSFIEGSSDTTKKALGDDAENQMLPFVVDPTVVFGTDTSLAYPKGFFTPKTGFDVSDIPALSQGTTSRTPCAFAGTRVTLAPGESVTISSIYGHADDLETFVHKISPRIRQPGYLAKKREAANSLVDLITSRVASTTGSEILNAYVKQNFLDNILRGGLPIILGDSSPSSKPRIYHTFSRIHGDIERDYNFFQIDTTYFSQGSGNFRDVNQNRRLDVSHTPAVGDYNVRTFLSFVQADGYNPLTVATSNFKVDAELIPDVIATLGIIDNDDKTYSKAFVALLQKPFRVGQLFRDMKSRGIASNLNNMDFINKLAAISTQIPAAQYAQNGYWSDHWTYLLDLVDNYNHVYPDSEEHLLWDSEKIPFYMSPAIVRDRKHRYSLVDDSARPGMATIRSYGAVSSWGDIDFPPARQKVLASIYSDPKYVADMNGAGGAFVRAKDLSTITVTIASKLFMLATIKCSTLDPFGMGLEMEGGKPGWNDAMNGLPGLLGSGMPETYELLRLVRYVKQVVVKYKRDIEVPIEFKTFVDSMYLILKEVSDGNDEKSLFLTWDKLNTAREVYRSSIVGFFDGSMASISNDYTTNILTLCETRLTQGIDRAVARSSIGMSPTYFYYSATNFVTTPAVNSTPFSVAPTEFKVYDLPYFLEGPTRQLKIVQTLEERRKIFQTVKSSTLYDSALQMFTMSESLKDAPPEVGRAKAFSPGWLENQSVWLHMSYKFYLELLRGRLYEEFFQEIQTGLVPFMDHSVYGRSPLEASSFIVSSCFPDSKIQGTGFLARLSGSTAEFMSMWSIMMEGHQPFYVNSNNELEMTLEPILPGWIFTEDGTVSFTFLGSITITYNNPSKLNTWNQVIKNCVIVDKAFNSFYLESAVFEPLWAKQIRNGQVESISCSFE